MRSLPELDLTLHRMPNASALAAVIDLGRLKNWATVTQIRCGAMGLDGKACARQIPQRVLSTSRGLLVWGTISTGHHDQGDVYVSAPNKDDDGRSWGDNSLLYGLLAEFPPPPNWWWASCDRGHNAVVVLEQLRADVTARKRSHLTTPVVMGDDGYPTLL